MRLLVTRRMTDTVMAEARARFDVTLRDSDRPMDSDECAAALRDFDLILPTLGDAFRAPAFDQVPAPRARVLANFGVGYNHIDVEAAHTAGVIVTNTPGAVTEATADLALCLMLMTARRASEGERMLRAGEWTGWQPTQLLGLHMSGKRLGILGMGRIGKAIARRAHHGFAMEILFFNRSPVTGLDHPAVRLDSIAEVMRACDIVVVALPGGPATRHIVGAAEIAAMRPHAHLVNIARGDVIDEAALIEALAQGRIAGAGLDVYEHEPHVPEALRALRNVTLLPHLGTNAEEVRTAMGRMALANLIAVADGKDPPNRV
ncbi:MAG: 2-hydroxyacid dehydrogenase [Pseudomonadota bacterium]